MYISPSELIILYRAVKAYDIACVKALTENFITKYGNQVLQMRSPNPYSNYFFRIDDVVGLCVEDTQDTRKTARDHGVSDHIYFGRNSDPVEELTLEQLSTLMLNVTDIPEMMTLQLK